MTNTVVVVGAGLAGLVATAELLAAGQHVTLLDAENAASLGGQAFWSFGGLFLVDSPEQRRLGVKDSADLALADWLGSAQFGARRPLGPRVGRGVRVLRRRRHAVVAGRPGREVVPARAVGRARRVPGRAGTATRSPGSTSRGAPGPASSSRSCARCWTARRDGRVDVRFRHRVTGLVTTDGVVTGVRGDVLASDGVDRAVPSSRTVVRPFELAAAPS